MGYRYGHSQYRYGHPGYRYGIWANDMGDDSIDMVILDIDMGCLVTLGDSPTDQGGHLGHGQLQRSGLVDQRVGRGVAAQVEFESNR